MTETFTVSTQPSKPLKMSRRDQTAFFEGVWHILNAALTVATMHSPDTRLRLVFLPARRKWSWTLFGAIDSRAPKWPGISAETLVLIARMLPVQTSATETLEAYFARDDTLRIDVVDASEGSCLAEFVSWDDLDRFAVSRSNPRRLN